VGLDFSGNPTRNSFADFLPAFEDARRLGLRVAVHTAEVDNDADTAAVLDFGPERLGG
jgi:adenosine deaminase